MVGLAVRSAHADPACTTNRPVCTVKRAAMSGGVCNMWTMSIDDKFRVVTFPTAEAAGAAALDFLERSREVAPGGLRLPHFSLDLSAQIDTRGGVLF